MDVHSKSCYPVTATARLRVLSDAGDGLELPVMLEISRSGTRVECSRYLRQHSQVSIHTEDETILGTIQTCTEIRSGLFAFGIRVRDVV